MSEERLLSFEKKIQKKRPEIPPDPYLFLAQAGKPATRIKPA